MSDALAGVLVVLGAQHLWQGAVLFALAWSALRLQPQRPEARAWIWWCAFVLAVALPLAVFLPAEATGIETPQTVIAIGNAPTVEGMATSAASADTNAPAFTSAPALHSLAVLAWLLGAAWNFGRLWLGWWTAQKLRNGTFDAPELKRVLGGELPSNTTIKVSDRVASPMVVGLTHPCILIPHRFVAELPMPALQAIVHHEIAHVRRRDLWLSLVQQLMAAVYWWSPWLRLIGRQLELAREIACDAHAAWQSGSRTYANALLAGAGVLLPHKPSRPLLAVGAFGNRGKLTRRIEELLNMDGKTPNSGLKLTAVVCALLLAGTSLTWAATPRLGSSPSGKAQQLLEAVRADRLDQVQRLLRSGVPVDAGVTGDGTALIVAARAGNPRMITALLRMGADVNRAWRGDGNPLIAAAGAGHRETVAQLVAYGAEVDAIVHHDETPLIAAIRAGHLPVVEHLVEHGADVNLGVHTELGRWRSPLNQARNARIRDYLLDHGAKPGP